MRDQDVLEIIERIRKVGFVPGLRNVTGSYRFDVEGVGSWRVEVERGHVVLDDTASAADCTVRVGAEDFARIASGAQNLVTAWMQGLLELEGDLSLAQKLHGILPRKAAAHHE